MMTALQLPFSLASNSCGIELLEDGSFFYCQDGHRIQWAHSRAESSDGRRIDTRSAHRERIDSVQVNTELGIASTVTEIFSENDLRLYRTLSWRTRGARHAPPILHRLIPPIPAGKGLSCC